MHQDQGIALPLGNKPGTDDGFADTRRCDEDARILFAQFIDGLFLDGVSLPSNCTSSGSPGWRWSSMVNVLPY
jgi:hypothetical protein